MDDELELAIAALRTSESRFRSIVDDIDALIMVFDADGRIELVNRQALDYFGKTLQELRAWATTEAVHPDDLPGVISSWRCALQAEQRYQREYRIRRFDGAYRWYRSCALPVRDHGGRVIRWYCVKTDIDEQKKAEALLAGEKRLLEIVASQEPLEVVLHALCGIVEQLIGACYCSVAVLDLDGDSIQHAVAPSLPASYTGNIAGRPIGPSGPCPLAAHSKAQVIVSNLAADDRWDACGWRALAQAHGLVACWSTPMLSRGGNVLGTLAVQQKAPARPTPNEQDLMARFSHIASIAIERSHVEAALNRLRSELSHVSRVQTLGTLTASIAHELNQPLTGMVTNAGTCLRMLSSEVPRLEGARETARRMIRDAHRAADVISRLRSLFGKSETKPQSLDMNEAIAEVVALAHGELQRGGVKVQLELDCRLPLARGDRVQLQQVLLNLILNAAESMHDVVGRARQLVVQSECDGNEARITVRDSGIGLEPQHLHKLFEPFFSTKHNGMGVGLSVSRAIVESHGGRLWARANDGPGATFAFSVPLAPG